MYFALTASLAVLNNDNGGSLVSRAGPQPKISCIKFVDFNNNNCSEFTIYVYVNYMLKITHCWP